MEQENETMEMIKDIASKFSDQKLAAQFIEIGEKGLEKPADVSAEEAKPVQE